MAQSTRITTTPGAVLLRASANEFSAMREIVCRRYPDYEWATFAHFGWRQTPSELVLTLARLTPSQPGELDDDVGHVAIREPYTLRVALDAEHHPLAIGVIHSHPRQCPPAPSVIDDDMDAYYSKYFAGFAPDRPYVSLILSELDDGTALSGRVWWRGAWNRLTHVAVERIRVNAWPVDPLKAPGAEERHKRLAAAFGDEATSRLRRSTVAVIGAGGTGSAAIETLARAGVGRLVIVDPDHLERSNLERVHGSTPVDAAQKTPKTAIAQRHVATIDPACHVDSFIGALPHPAVVDAVITADVMIGCTDQQHSRLALSDLARRYLIPAIDCGVVLEGKNGSVTAQVIQCVRFLPDDPCPLCRQMIVPEQLAQELMDPAERAQRRAAAADAVSRGDEGAPYWRDLPQLNTVGYLTTIAGAMAAGYAIGWITGRFTPPFSRLQMNLLAPFFDVTNLEQSAEEDCACRRARGWADQGAADALISAPSHWQTVRQS
jgi:molybdopterin/thiamine biosynthesis adenylyltransferase